jgi:hypothetical protein
MAYAYTRVHGNKDKECYTKTDRMNNLSDAVLILIEAAGREKHFDEIPSHLLLV